MPDEPDLRSAGFASDSTIGKSSVIGKVAEGIFEGWLPAEWLIRRQTPDVFLDYVVEIVESGEPTGVHFAAQIKGIKVGKTSSIPLTFSAKGKHVRYWVHKCTHPVFLFLIDVENRVGHWIFVQRWTKENISKSALERQKSITLRFDSLNSLSNLKRFASTIRDAADFVRDLHPGSIHAAIEKVRLEFEQKEPRFAYEISATERGPVIHCKSREAFPFGLSFVNPNARLTHEAFKASVESGKPMEFQLSDVKFSGSPLFEEFSGQKGRLVIDPGQVMPGMAILSFIAENSIENLAIEGSYRIGTKAMNFHGELAGAPLILNCTWPSWAEKEEMDVKLEFIFPFKRWEGERILDLPSFKSLTATISQFFSGGVVAEWLIAGKPFAKDKIAGSPYTPELKKFVQVSSWLQQCRFVAEKFNVNPRLPVLETITADQIESVTDLFALMNQTKCATPCPQLSARFGCRPPTEDKLLLPSYGCLMLEKPNAEFDILGERVVLGPIRIMLTNINLSPEGKDNRGIITFVAQGTGSSLRIIERIAACKQSQ
jgi:hypothetical protein